MSMSSLSSDPRAEVTSPLPEPEPEVARSVLPLLYGGVAYLIGSGALLALIAVSLGVVPFDAPATQPGSPWISASMDVGLLALFGLQHSVMARRSFKQSWTRVVPPALERSTYVLATGLVLVPVLVFWQPIPGVIWSIEVPLVRAALRGLALVGWCYLFAASFALSHVELFGLKQVWRVFHGESSTEEPFRERWMYRFDRHPIMTGLLVGMWSTPDMTAGRLLFCAGMTVYVVIGVHFEERALRRQWGARYDEYRARVRSVVPTWRG